MPRRPRLFVEGAVYHVYNRLGRGAELFADRKTAERFLDLVARVRDRDGLTILAWCLMPNHYHLAVRTGPVPLSRSMGFVQSRFGQAHNRRSGLLGPIWQSRYKAKLVTDERHLMQLVAYVHLNPVSAGVVKDPSRYRLCGHGELLGTEAPRLVDVDGTLALFGGSRRTARRAYLGVLKGDREAPWVGDEPGTLPWWQREPDAAIEAAPAGPRLDPLGRSGGLEQRRLDAEAFIEQACAILGVPRVRLESVGKDRELSEIRYLLGGLAIERWRVGAKELSAVLGRRPEVVSRWAARAGELRQQDGEFRRRYEQLDAALSGSRRRQRG